MWKRLKGARKAMQKLYRCSISLLTTFFTLSGFPTLVVVGHSVDLLTQQFILLTMPRKTMLYIAVLFRIKSILIEFFCSIRQVFSKKNLRKKSWLICRFTLPISFDDENFTKCSIKLIGLYRRGVLTASFYNTIQSVNSYTRI